MTINDLISQLNDHCYRQNLFEHPLHDHLGLDNQLRSIRGSIKVEVVKRFSWKNALRKRIASSRNSENILECMEMTNVKRLRTELKD